MADGEKVGAVYVSVGVDTEGANEALNALEERINALEGREVKIKVNGNEGTNRGPANDPTSPPPSRHATGAPPPPGSGSTSSTHQAQIEANVSGLRAKIEQELKAPFQITLEIANLSQIREQIEGLGGDVRVNVQAQGGSGGGGGGTSGGGGSTTSSQTPIPTSFNAALAKSTSDTTGLGDHVKTLAGILDSVGKSMSMPTNPSGPPSASDEKRFIAQALQRLGVAGQSGADAAGIIRRQLQDTGKMSDADIDAQLVSLGYRPKGSITTNAEGVQKRSRVNRYGGVLRAAQHAPTAAAAPPPAAPAAPTSVVTPKPEAPAPAPAVEQAEAQTRRERDAERQEAQARARLRIEREEREKRGPLPTMPSRRSLPDPKPRGNPMDSRGARTVPGVRIRDAYNPEDTSGQFIRAEQVQIPVEDPQDVAMRERGIQGPARVARMETGYRLPENAIARIIEAEQMGGMSVTYEGVPAPARGPQGGSRNAQADDGTSSGVGRYSISNAAPEKQGQRGNEVQYSRTGGNIAHLRGGRFENLIGQFEEAIAIGEADAPGAVLKGGKRTGDIVQIPTVTQSTVDDPSGLKDQYGTSLIPSGTGLLNIAGYGENTEVERLSLSEWVLERIRGIDPNAADDPEVQRAVAELTKTGGHLHQAMQNRRAQADPRTIMPPGKKTAPGAPRASNNRLMGGGAASLQREAENARSYGYLGYEGQFIDAEKMTAEDKVAFESLGYQPITIAGSQGMTYAQAREAAQVVFPGREVAPIYRHGPPLEGEDEPTYELAGFAPTDVQRGSAEMRQEEIRRQEAQAAFAKENRLRVLRSSHPEAFKSTGEPNPDVVDEYGMLKDPTALTADDAHRVTAAEDQFYGMMSGGIADNPIWALANRWSEHIKTGTYDRGAISGGATEAVGRFDVGTPFSQGVTRDQDGNWTTQDPRRGAFEFELQQELNKEGGLWDQLGLTGDQRPQSMKGIISKLQNLGPAGRQILGPAVTSVLQQIDNTEYFGQEGAAGLAGRETQAGRTRIKRATAKGKAARNSRTRGVAVDAAGRRRRSYDDVGSVPEFVYNPYSGPMAELREELEGPKVTKGEDKDSATGVGLDVYRDEFGNIVPEDQIGGIRGQATPAAEELAGYEAKLEGRRRERAREKALKSRGLDPRLTDEQLAQGEKRTRVKPGGDTITYRKGGVSPTTGKPTMRLHVGRETEEYYEPYEGYDAEAIAAEVESGGYINAGEKTRLASLKAKAAAERTDIDAQVAARETELARMEEVREQAYAKADRLMGQHGKGYAPSEEELRTSVMNDPRIPQGMHGEVADTMQQQMERGGGSMVMAFGERGKVPIFGAHGKVMGYEDSPTATTRRRAEETEHDMGLRTRVEGDIIYDRRTAGRNPPRADEYNTAYGERAGVVTPGQRDNIRIRRDKAADTSGVEQNAAQRAIESIEGGGVRISRGGAARAAAAAAGGGGAGQTLAGIEGVVDVNVVNWPEGFAAGGAGGDDGGGTPPTAEGGDTGDSEKPKEPPIEQRARETVAAQKKKDSDRAAVAKAAEMELEEKYGGDQGDPYPVTEAGAKLNAQLEKNRERQQKQKDASNRAAARENREYQAQERARAQAEGRASASVRVRTKRGDTEYETEVGTADAVYDMMQHLYSKGNADDDGNLMQGPVPWTSSLYQGAKKLAEPEIDARKRGAKAGHEAKIRATAAAEAAKVSTGGAQADAHVQAYREREQDQAKRLETAQRKRQAIENSDRRPSTKGEMERLMIAQGVPSARRPGGPFGIPEAPLDPEAFELTRSSGLMQQVRAGVRVARGRNPQRALGTAMIQSAQNFIGNAEQVSEDLARVEQMNAVLGAMGRRYAGLEQRSGSLDGRRVGTNQTAIATIQESMAVTRRDRAEAYLGARAARARGDRAGEAEQMVTVAQHTKTLDQNRLAIVKHEDEIRRDTNSMRELDKHMNQYGQETLTLAKRAGSLSNWFRNMGAGFVGGIAGGFVTMAVSGITQGIMTGFQTVVAPALDKAMGSGAEAQRRQRAAADAFKQSGFRQSSVESIFAMAGFDASEVVAMSELANRQASAVAGADQMNERLQLRRTQRALDNQQRAMGLPSDVAPGLFAGSGALLSGGPGNMLGVGSIAEFGAWLMGREIDYMDFGGTDSAAKMHAAEIADLQANQLRNKTFDEVAIDAMFPWEMLGDTFNDGWDKIRIVGDTNEELIKINKKIAASGVKIVSDPGGYGLPVNSDAYKLMDSVPGMADIINSLKDQKLTVEGLENVEQIYEWIRLASEPDRDFRATSDIFMRSTSFNNQVWALGQQQHLQREQLRMSMGLQAQGSLPLQFGTGIAYRPGMVQPVGAASTSELNQRATEIDDSIMAGSQQALDDLVSIYGVSQDLVTEFQTLSGETRDWSQQIGEIQQSQGLRQFNLQLEKAQYQMADLRGLMGKEGGSEIGNLQRANVLLQRRQQLLQFEMQQRKINFSVAMAGFQSIGLTGEERAANIRIAKKEAAFQQESLDINRQMFGNNIQLFDEQNIRNFRMLAKDVNNLIQTFDENAKIAELNQAIQKATRRQNQLNQEIGQMLSQEMEVLNLQSSIIKQMADDTNKKLTLTGKMETISSRLKSSVNKIADAIEKAEETIQTQNDEENLGDQAGGGGPIHITVNVAGHAVPVDQIAAVIERKLGEQGELRGLNT